MPDPHVLEVLDVVEETPEACSIVFAVPPALRETYAYRPGQFLTIAIPSDEAEAGHVARSYSLSSAPCHGLERLQVTVKRTPDGYGSRWVCEALRPGHPVLTLPPAGVFVPRDLDDDLLLFAAGSGITPSMSILQESLSCGSGRTTLVYANRDRQSVIFGDRLDELAARFPGRLEVLHWLESERGLPAQDDLRAVAEERQGRDAFVCGPTPFMKAATGALRELDWPRARRHQEKFASLGGNPFGDATVPADSPRLAPS